jgi:hypothetical protein
MNRKKTSKKIINFIELEWDDKCRSFYNTKRAIKTASNWQVRQPMYRDSVKRWKNYEKHLGTLRHMLELPAK